MHKRVAAASGQPFNIQENQIQSNASGSWERIGAAVSGRGVRVQGVYWTATHPGARLYIRDLYRSPGSNSYEPGAIWYEADCLGGDSHAIDMFPAHLTLITPFEYFDTQGGNRIIIYGEFV